MTTTYSRKFETSIYALDLQPGDLIDISVNDKPFWSTVTSVGKCSDDPYASYDNCDDPDECVAVIFHNDGEYNTAWHLAHGDTVFARMLAETTHDEIATVNDAHDAA